jgi:hypothetical protein
MKQPILLFAGFLATLAIHGCGGGGGGGGGSGVPSQPSTAEVSLFPSSGMVSQGQDFTRTVEVRNVGKTFFVAFDVTYDPKVIKYVDTVEDTFLNRNNQDQTTLQAALQNGVEGRVTIGLTRQPDPFGGKGDVYGSGQLLTLHFKAVGPGTTSLSFSDPKGFVDSTNNTVSIGAWQDGTVTVQ